MTWCAQCMQEIYSAPQDESATMACCFELQESGPLLHSIMKPETDFWDLDMAQSELVKAWKMGGEESTLL